MIILRFIKEALDRVKAAHCADREDLVILARTLRKAGKPLK